MHDDPAGDLSCQRLVELVTDWLDGALSEAERRRLEAHLDECPDCAAYVAQFEATIAAVRALPPCEPAPGRVDALLAALRAEGQR